MRQPHTALRPAGRALLLTAALIAATTAAAGAARLHWSYQFPRRRARQPFNELSVQITRPLAWLAWQAKFLSGLLVDRDNDDVRGRLSGAPKMEQPLQLEVLLNF